ncbi:hypothetical protein POMI540_1722 [Schizosaccharomyces pombe]|uniref:DSC E3 ubiquitin ligase complex subunit 3 n=1 Tax=Schizosaccharomyces pombe (strain 972 / ATCC 24843) TaxID=284812 RepID=DSC3_SCHPO|nr:protein dsc3 [Schizosaccharomyces pombe]Q9HE10.1 RecName: Full=DSC E3 ubiquitin ligase complex subunit 3; AltName: Full=Defective for SREBP cleavage protein 3 [Schizosaccharomyces pombe 972h-]CAC19732.1 conserved fungal protein [Schizosaccharomyces pombe]|eukprot:NP_593622.1 protein dsc3 [Schizosaccharomyces pombe]
MSSSALKKWEIVIRFASSIPDLSLEISDAQTTTIHSLFKIVRNRIPECRDKQLKMVFQGRLLSPGFTVERAVRGNWQRDENDDPNIVQKAFIHCIVGPTLTEEELASQDQAQSGLNSNSESPDDLQNAQTGETLRGFDRLREAGFTETEVNNLRSQFHRLRGTNLDSLTEDAIREAEDDWIDNGGQNSSADELDMSYETLLAGVLIGFFGGAIACYFLWERTMFSLRMQLSILVGIICNFAYGLLHSYRW